MHETNLDEAEREYATPSMATTTRTDTGPETGGAIGNAALTRTLADLGIHRRATIGRIDDPAERRAGRVGRRLRR